MPDYDIDLTLDSLMIPAISGTFPFGTKVIPTAENKGGLSTAEVNSNVMLPFTRMRPRVCSADSVTSRVEYDAKIVFSAPSGTTPASGYTLTLGTGDYVGCTVTFTNLLAHACTVRQSDGTTTLFSVPAGKTMSAMWTGRWTWTTSGTVSANDPTPVSSAAVQSAIGEVIQVVDLSDQITNKAPVISYVYCSRSGNTGNVSIKVTGTFSPSDGYLLCHLPVAPHRDVSNILSAGNADKFYQIDTAGDIRMWWCDGSSITVDISMSFTFLIG